jgi:hypothetical protein
MQGTWQHTGAAVGASSSDGTGGCGVGSAASLAGSDAVTGAAGSVATSLGTLVANNLSQKTESVVLQSLLQKRQHREMTTAGVKNWSARGQVVHVRAVVQSMTIESTTKIKMHIHFIYHLPAVLQLATLPVSFGLVSLHRLLHSTLSMHSTFRCLRWHV